MNDVRKLAVFMHEEYELIAREEKWSTNKNCQVPFKDLPTENKRVMLKLAERVLDYIKKRGGQVD